MCSDREGKGEQFIQVKVAFIFFLKKLLIWKTLTIHCVAVSTEICRGGKLEEESLKHSLLYAEHIVPVLDGHHPVHSLYQSLKMPL